MKTQTETPTPTALEVVLEVTLHVAIIAALLIAIVLGGCTQATPAAPDAHQGSDSQLGVDAPRCDICPVGDPDYRIVCDEGCVGSLSRCACVGPDRWAPCGTCELNADAAP
jgi:hypothetical protein